MNTLIIAQDATEQELLELLTSTPAAPALLLEIMQAEARRIGLNLAEAAQ